MWINCKILSDNFLLYYKFEQLINHTPFFSLIEPNMDKVEEGTVIFWDIDSININKDYIRECINTESIVIIISSQHPKNVILNLFEEEDQLKMGILNKNILHQKFVEEISLIIDEKI